MDEIFYWLDEIMEKNKDNLSMGQLCIAINLVRYSIITKNSLFFLSTSIRPTVLHNSTSNTLQNSVSSRTNVCSINHPNLLRTDTTHYLWVSSGWRDGHFSIKQFLIR